MSDAVLEAEARLKNFISGELVKINQDVEKFGKNTSGVMGSVANSSSVASGGMAGLGSAVGSMKGAMLAATPIIAALGLFKLTKDASDAGSAFLEMSQKTGVSTEFLSAFDYVAKQAGTNVESLQGSFRKLSIASYEAAKGGAEQKEAFAKLGIQMDANYLATQDNEEILKSSLLALSDVKNKTEQVALAQKLFGKSGVDLLPILVQGKEAINEQMEAAKAMGLVWTDEAANSADAFGDAVGSLAASFQGLLQQAVTPLIKPMLTLINAAKVGVVAFDVFTSASITGIGKIASSLFYLSQGQWEKAKAAFTNMDFAPALRAKLKELDKTWDVYVTDNPLTPPKIATKGGGKVNVNNNEDAIKAAKEKADKEKAFMEEVQAKQFELKALSIKATESGLTEEQALRDLALEQEIVSLNKNYENKLISLNEFMIAVNDAERIAEEEKDAMALADIDKKIELAKQEVDLTKKVAKEKKDASDEARKKEEANNDIIRSTFTNMLGGMSQALLTFGAKNKALRIAGKAAAISETVINTSVAIMKSYRELGPIVGTAAAIGMGALGAVQIAKISGAKFGEGGMVSGPSHGQGGVYANLEGGEYVVRKDDVNRLGGLSGIRNSLSGKNQGAYVDAKASINIVVQGNLTQESVQTLNNTLTETYDQYLIKLENGLRDIKTRGLVIT